MAASIVQALIRWCETNDPHLRDGGVSLQWAASSNVPSSGARVDLETATAMFRVTVWDHNGMCDVEQLTLSSCELRDEHHEHLDPPQLTRLLDELAVRVRAV